MIAEVDSLVKYTTPISSTTNRYSIHTYVMYTYDLDLSPLTLKTVSLIPTHVMNICQTFH